MPGMAEDESAAVKFRPLEDMSDSDEADMSVSSEDEPSKDAAADADADADGGEPKKKARTALDTSKDGDSVPKWSNPDPYFVLPPSLDDPARKKTDVVKLIRKARVSTGNEVAKHKDTADDFISFDFDDDDEKLKAAEDTPDESEEEDAGRGMPGAPTGPSAGAAQTNGATSRMLKFDDSEKVHPDLSPDEALGNRKRTHDDEIKGDVPSPLRSKKGRQEPPKQILGIIKEWRAKPGDNPTPWCTVDHSATLNMGAW
jgi:non-canonical poly(A) RNA polymerase PAPD5/7